MSVSKTEVASPCVRLCALDDNRVCQGCGRNVQQITDWRFMNNAQKQAVIDSLKNFQVKQ